ncbi:hypothetical protein SELMODRAFT_421193 [Selaginella moellendorffii]|uniref:Uncharacterized protein n=1 Tax=Selaginella moellendorffii TaxID=88036 RepID=D8SEB3_SELML|nr:hypothetical protein SELMODRAFT_421193 [Selaginella moellendorffii]
MGGDKELTAKGINPCLILNKSMNIGKKKAGVAGNQYKKPKIECMPADFLEFFPIQGDTTQNDNTVVCIQQPRRCSQFWKAENYDGSNAQTMPAGMDHVRMHPKFPLTQEATTIAELLDNALNQKTNGVTFANIDVLKNPVNGMAMLLFEDGNGFKTSKMCLGGDVIVFSRSNTAVDLYKVWDYSLRASSVLDYEGNGHELKEIHKGTHQDWKFCMDVITKWSPYQNEGSIHSQMSTKVHFWKDYQKKQTERPIADVAFATEKRNMMHEEKTLCQFQNVQQTEHIHNRTFYHQNDVSLLKYIHKMLIIVLKNIRW